jgi:lipid-A-disaccharide synthase-like uncharacterized protein
MSPFLELIKHAFQEQVIGDPIWATIGLIGQFVFGLRFILQWLASESRKKSHIPNSFWFLSLGGSLILLCYSIHIKNPIFMISFSVNSLIYLRNLHFIYKTSQQTAQ